MRAAAPRLNASSGTGELTVAAWSIVSLLEQNPSVLFPHRVCAQRLVCRRRQRFAGAQAEARAVAGADDLARLDFGAVERLAVVGAAVLDGVEVAAATHDDHREAVDFD